MKPSQRFHLGLAAALACLVFFFRWTLIQLAAFSIKDDLYSYTLLIPFISLYLAWQKRREIISLEWSTREMALRLLVVGVLLAAGYAGIVHRASGLPLQDQLAFRVLLFVLGVAGLCAAFFDKGAMRSLAFPLTFLALMAPFPIGLQEQIEHGLQVGSALIALALFNLSGTPVYYNDLVFKLSGISIEVAPECSGIHSSLVLLLVSFIAGYWYLQSPGKRALLAFATVPLALFRNGFRIFTIGELCVHVSPEMINSDLHRRGGPLFFALSLLPFSLLLWWLWRTDRRRLKTEVTAVS